MAFALEIDAFVDEMTGRSMQLRIALDFSIVGVPHMKTVKRFVILLAVACIATACAALPSAPSYVPSPFAGMHGQ